MSTQKVSGNTKVRINQNNIFVTGAKVILVSIPLWYSVFNSQAENVALHEDSAFLALIMVLGIMTVLSEHEFAKFSNHTTKYKVILILSCVLAIYISVLITAVLLDRDGERLLDFLLFWSGNFLYAAGFWIYTTLGFARIIFRDTSLSLMQLEEYSNKAANIVFYAMFAALLAHYTLIWFDIYANTLALYFISYLYISEFLQLKISRE